MLFLSYKSALDRAAVAQIAYARSCNIRVGAPVHRQARDEAVKNLSAVKAEIGQRLRAVLSDLHHRGEKIISTSRAAHLACVDLDGALEVLPTLLPPVQPGHYDFYKIEFDPVY